MNLSILDDVLWAASFAGQVVLLFVLLFRKRWREFPVFSLWIAFELIVNSIGLFAIYRYGSHTLYSWAYWVAAFLDIAIQLAVVWEVAHIVLRPTGTWVKDARALFVGLGVVGTLVAMGLAIALHPAASSSLNAWELRGEAFSSLLICELFVALLFASSRLALVWRHHVLGLAQGLAVWALISIGTDVAKNYISRGTLFAHLDHVRIFAYVGALVYWIVIFWLPEPVRQPLSPEMHNYLVALHKKVAYDLDTVSNKRSQD